MIIYPFLYHRIDTDELKQLLRKHNSAFTEEEIFEIGELFYAGKSGGSVPFDRFVEAVDRVVQLETRDDVARDVDGNPLQIGSCGKFAYSEFELSHLIRNTIADTCLSFRSNRKRVSVLSLPR